MSIFMSAPIMNRRDIEFYRYEMFNVEALTSRERYQDHDKETFNGAIESIPDMASAMDKDDIKDSSNEFFHIFFNGIATQLGR